MFLFCSVDALSLSKSRLVAESIIWFVSIDWPQFIVKEVRADTKSGRK